MSADNRGIHIASCKNRTPCVFPISRGGVNGHSIYTMLT